MNAKKGACNEARSSKEEHVDIRDSMRKGDFEHSKEESNENSSDEEENRLPMSGRKGDGENSREKENKKINEEKDIGRRKCRTKSPIVKYNEEVKGWTYSSKNPERPPDIKKRKRIIVKKSQKERKNKPPLNGMI